MDEGMLNKIVDDYYSECPCVDTNQESNETYDNDEGIKSNINKNRFDFLLNLWYNLITIIDIETNYY